MSIDRNTFLKMAMAISVGGAAACGPSNPPPMSPGNTATGTEVHGRGMAPADECVDWDATGECVAWDQAYPYPAAECVDWDPSGECIGWDDWGPADECVDWNPAGECVEWM